MTHVLPIDELAGLQSVAAILGAISFGIFIGLLICSVLYKRWSNDRTEVEVEHDPANDYDDAIQQAAPPSYRKGSYFKKKIFLKRPKFRKLVKTNIMKKVCKLLNVCNFL